MSATSQAAATARGTPLGRRDIRPLLWAFSITWIAGLAWGISRENSLLSKDVPSLLPWIALLLVMHALPVSGWQRSQLIVDHPIQAAAALLFMPIEAGLMSTLTWVDRREFRGEITPTKAIFNRCQAGVCGFIGSAAIHSVAPSPVASRLALPLALLAIAASTAANGLFVASVISIEHRYPLPEVIRRLPTGTPVDFALSLIAWAMLGGMLAIVYMEIRSWALLAFAAPALLTRQVLMRSKMLVDTSKAYRSRERALAKISEQIRQERLDERRLIAADLHDEILQPLFKVSLMGQVLKGDLASGRLLELDQDLPELITAAELAANTLRELIGDLRSSALGRGGLSPALARLLRSTAERSGIQVHTDIAPVEASGDIELAVYQIAKEAIANAITHARAARIWVRLEKFTDGICLTVEDNGVGFDPEEPKEGHFGLHIMRERAAAIHGHLSIEAISGQGCSIVLFVPRV